MASDQSWQSEAFGLCAEVVDSPHQVHPRLQGFTLSGERSRASGQAVKTTAKGSVDSLNEGGVDVAFALCFFDHRCDCLLCSLIDLAPHTDDSIVLFLLDHLPNQQVGPFDQVTTPCFLAWLFLAEDFQNRLRIAHQAIDTEENRPARRRGAAFDPTDEILNQLAVSRCTDFSAQPQTGRDLDRHRHPDDRALNLDPQLIGLDLAQWPRLLDQMLVHLLRMLPALLKPVPDRSLIKAEGGDNRLDRAPVPQQGHHQVELPSTTIAAAFWALRL